MVLIKTQGAINGYDLFLRYVNLRISQNKNCLIICTGPTGSGKSWSNLKLCEDLDEDFDITRVSFKPEQFMSVINSGLLKRKGAAVIFEEAGVSYSSRNFYSTTNKLLNYFMQTARSLNHILIFNTPDMSFVDSAARKLFHIHLQTVGIDHKEKVVKLKPLYLQTAQATGKTYRKYLQVRVSPGFGGVRKIKRIDVPIPSENLRKMYEEKKLAYLNSLNKEIQDTLIRGKKKPLTEKQQKWYDLHSIGHSVEEIAKIMEISVPSSYIHRRYILNKGYSLEKSVKNVN